MINYVLICMFKMLFFPFLSIFMKSSSSRSVLIGKQLTTEKGFPLWSLVLLFLTVHLHPPITYAFCWWFWTQQNMTPVMNLKQKQMCQEAVRNTFLWKYKHKEARGRRTTVFLFSALNSCGTLQSWLQLRGCNHVSSFLISISLKSLKSGASPHFCARWQLCMFFLSVCVGC